MSPVLLAGIVAGLALILTAVLTPVVRGAAISGGMVRQVQSDRWHKRPTPAIGGVAIFLGFGVAVAVGYVVDPSTIHGLSERAPRALVPWSPWEGLVVASTLAFLLGLVDDLTRLPPLPKLAGQVVAASVLLVSGVGVWLTGVYALDAVISLFWFVGITNALNLLDNMDGVAAGIAAIGGAYLAVIFVSEGSTAMAILALAFVASLLGFLAHNYPPARIFMGDSGSLFLGLFLAGLALAPAQGTSRSLAAVLAVPVLILGVPILDTTLVTVGRLLEGRPVSQGGKDHTSHRFVALGMPEKRTLWLLWSLAAVGGGVGILFRTADRGLALLLGGVLVGMLALVGGYLMAVRFRTLDAETPEGLSLYRFLVHSQARYPVMALFMDAVWVTLAYYGAYLIRWDAGELTAELPYFERTVLVWVAIKVVAFAVTGMYRAYWPTFGLYDALRIVRVNIVASLLAAGVLFLTERTGLSRGVVAIDFLLCTLLTVGARFTFRLVEGTAQRWSEEGTPVVLLAEPDDAEIAVRQLARIRDPRLRPVAVAAPGTSAGRATLGALPLFGRDEGLRRALQATGANAVVLASAGDDRLIRAALARHLEAEGAVDTYRLEVSVTRISAVAEDA